MKILEPPTLWLISISQRGRSRRPNTWKAYAASVLDFLHFCEAMHINYLEPVRGLLAAYRDQLQTRVILRRNIEKPLAPKTINHRTGSVAAFYTWMLEEGYVSSLPFRRDERYQVPRDFDVLAHTRSRKRSSNDVFVPTNPEDVPKALSIDVIKSLMNALRERDACIMSIGLSAGPRIDEILQLNLDQIPNDQLHLGDKSVAIYITKTKGLVPRNIHVPLPILTDLNRYIFGERARIVRSLKSEGKKWDTKALFLSAQGKRLSYKTFWRAFRDAAAAVAPRAVVHDARHTFAIYTLAHLRKVSSSDSSGRALDPLSQLQGLLGHKRISTTQIYVRALHVDPHAAEDAMQQFVSQWLHKA